MYALFIYELITCNICMYTQFFMFVDYRFIKFYIERTLSVIPNYYSADFKLCWVYIIF